MTRKKELQEEAKALGIDPEGLKVAELETAIGEAQAAQTDEAPVAEPSPAPTPATSGPHAAHAYGTSQGVHLQLGHMIPDADGTAQFHLASEFVLGRDAALVLAEELPGAAADHNTVGAHYG